MSTTPEQLVAELSDLYRKFDELAVKHVSVPKDLTDERKAAKRDAFAAALEARDTVAALEKINDRLVDAVRRLR